MTRLRIALRKFHFKILDKAASVLKFGEIKKGKKNLCKKKVAYGDKEALSNHGMK